MTNPRLILASASPRRRLLFGVFRTPFDVRTSHVDEDALLSGLGGASPDVLVTTLAEAKAREVARSSPDDALVIGADTIVWLDGQVLNKPLDADDAVRMLLSLSGRAHTVYTGIALVPGGECALRPAQTQWESTVVTFRPISRAEAQAYAASGEPMDKAGAYGIQDSPVGARLVRCIRGDYYNVVGLPLGRLSAMIRRHIPEFPPAPPQPEMSFPILPA